MRALVPIVWPASRAPRYQRGRRALGLAAILVAMGCASQQTGSLSLLRGVSAGVAWEVLDIGQIVSSDNQRIRWSYLILLRNASDRAIQLERLERAIAKASGDAIGGTPISQPFRRTLAARSELRIPISENWGWAGLHSNRTFGGAATLNAITAFHLFRGTDDRGTPIEIQVRVHLDSSVGVLAKPPTKPLNPPAPTRLESPSGLTCVIGLWRGSYRQDGTTLDVPIEVTILSDGTFQVAENEPVTNRFTRTLTVKDGALDYSGGRDVGTLSFHEMGNRRMLIGRVSVPEAPTYAIYLEGQEPRTAASPSPIPQPPTPLQMVSPAPVTGLPLLAKIAFEEYKADPKYTPFKAFALDRRSGVWGRAWGHGWASMASDRALEECRKRAGGCEVYAVGETVLESVSPEQRALILLAGAFLTYKGELIIEQDGQTEQAPATFYLRQGATEVAGSWQRPDPLISGVFTGDISDRARTEVRMTQSDPCRSSFSGVLSLRDGGTTLIVSYTGPGCDGMPLAATFTGTRQ